MSREGKVYDGRGDISPDFDRDYKALKKVENKVETYFYDAEPIMYGDE